MTPDDWPAVEDIHAQGIATGNATLETDTPSREGLGRHRGRWRDVVLMERRSETVGVGEA